jgi:8-oxo-dGTP pyrophosphatase MutT (NUDIX family)
MGSGGRSGGELTPHAQLDRIAALLAHHEPRSAERDPPYRDAAVAVVLTPRGDDVDLLLLRRATHAGDPWSGHVGLPGGRAEPSDASLIETAKRETLEETALDLNGARLLGTLDELRPRITVLPAFIVRPFVFAVTMPPALTPSEEVAELFWAPLGTLFDPARVVRTEVDARGSTLTVDAIDFEGRIIWGITERILRSLQSVLSVADR